MKFTEDDIFVDKWDGIIPNNESMIKIYCNEEKYGIELKQQIVDNQKKAEKWDKYSQQFETALRLYTDCKTMEEFFIKNQLPKFLVTITEDGKTKMEKIDSVKKIEQENKQLKEKIKEVVEN